MNVSCVSYDKPKKWLFREDQKMGMSKEQKKQYDRQVHRVQVAIADGKISNYAGCLILSNWLKERGLK